MNRFPLGATGLQAATLALALALVACGGGGGPGTASGPESGAEAPATERDAHQPATDTVASGPSDGSASRDAPSALSASGVDTGREGGAGSSTAPVVGTATGAAAAGPADAGSGSAKGADPPSPPPQPWEQKRAALLELIGRPTVALDATEAALPDDAGLSVHDFSIATDASTRINGTSFAPKLAGRLPAVLFLHGTGGSRQDGFDLLRTLAQRGFFALAIDARYHASGIGDAPYFSAIYASYLTGQGHPFLYDSVWDVLRLLDYLVQRPDVDATRIGLVGNSKGGMEAYLSAAIDPRIAVAVPWISVQSFAWALDNNQWQARVGSIQGAFDQAAAHDGVPIDVAFVRQFYDRVVPGITTQFDGPQMVAAIAPRPLLAVNGDMDPRTPQPGLQQCEASARAAYASVADHFELYLEPNTGHAVTAEATARTVDWLVQWLE